MATKKRTKAKLPIQIKSGKWYAFGHGQPLREECCDCGLVHDTTLKSELKPGGLNLWVKWDVNDAETRKARKRPQRFVRKSS